MRLIDADIALERFIKEAKNSGKGCIHINTIKRLLQDTDTAYDKEKVVAELEELENSKARCRNPVEMGKYQAYKKAIDIVKRGGVE